MGKNNKNKNSAKSAFYHFLMEFKNQHGRRNMSMQQAQEEAGKFWMTMNEAQRQPYVTMAKGVKENQMKMTSLKENIVDIERDDQEKIIKEQQRNDDIKVMIRKLHLNKAIATAYFHIMHINQFCYCTSEERYYIAEIALIRFNLEEGFTNDNVYHAVVKPAKVDLDKCGLPRGYQFEAKRKSDETHGLCSFFQEDDVPNVQTVMQNIYDFLKVNATSANTLPPIFVRNKDIVTVEKIFKQFSYDYEYDSSLFRIYPLDFFLYTLRNNIHGESVWPTINQSVLELDRDIYDYTEGISCEEHELNNKQNHCSRSVVIRTVYLICDNCCGLLNIDLINGKHIPLKSRGCHSPTRSETKYDSARGMSPHRYAETIASDATSRTRYDCEFVSAEDAEDDFTEVGRRRARKKNDETESISQGFPYSALSSQQTFESVQATQSSISPPLRRPMSGGVTDINSARNFLGKGRGRAKAQKNS